MTRVKERVAVTVLGLAATAITLTAANQLGGWVNLLSLVISFPFLYTVYYVWRYAEHA